MRPIAFVILALAAACDARGAAPPPPAAPARSQPPPAAPRARREWTRPAHLAVLPASEGAWARAEREQSAEAWRAAARAYEGELARCADCVDAAYAVVLARKNVLLAEPVEPPPGDQPAPLPPRLQAYVDALDAFVDLADPADPDLAGMKFLAASALSKWRQPDALARLEEVLREHRDHETAEYAANLLIDALLRAGRVDEVSALVDELLGDDAFLASRPALRQTLERLRAVIAAAR
jgi:pentatricopeptide repeat protein